MHIYISIPFFYPLELFAEYTKVIIRTSRRGKTDRKGFFCFFVFSLLFVTCVSVYIYLPTYIRKMFRRLDVSGKPIGVLMAAVAVPSHSLHHALGTPASFQTEVKRSICSSREERLHPWKSEVLGKEKGLLTGPMVTGRALLSPTSIRRSPLSGSSGGVGTGLSSSSSLSSAAGVPSHTSSINSVSLVGVAHDIQLGFVFEESVLQFTLTTTSLQTNAVVPPLPGGGTARPSHHGGVGGTEECVVEKDHHVIRCFGELFSQEVHQKIKEGSVVCINGRLRLNPQLEPSVNKYYYFPYIQVQPPYGQVAVIYTDRTSPPPPTESSNGNAGLADISGAPSSGSGGNNGGNSSAAGGGGDGAAPSTKQ